MSDIKLQTDTPPHADITVTIVGDDQSPKRALLLFHGRFSDADDILGIFDALESTKNVVAVAPTASGNQWYPRSFLEPRDANQPHLDSALALVERLIDYCDTEHGILPEDIVLAGFSQGACLVADYVARNPKDYGGVALFSGGLIGQDDEVDAQAWGGDLAGTKVYLGCDDSDPHIPLSRVEKTADIFTALNADVHTDIYTNFGHRVHPDGIEFLNRII